MSITAQIEDLLRPVVTDLGYDFWGCDYIAHGNEVLVRIYIDTDHGVTVDDCAIVSRQIGATLDVEDLIQHEYTLEVSSPGLTRPLFTLEQFRRYIGETIALTMRTPNIEGRRRFKGVLVSANDAVLELDVDNQVVELDFGDIDKAKLCA